MGNPIDISQLITRHKLKMIPVYIMKDKGDVSAYSWINGGMFRSSSPHSFKSTSGYCQSTSRFLVCFRMSKTKVFWPRRKESCFYAYNTCINIFIILITVTFSHFLLPIFGMLLFTEIQGDCILLLSPQWMKRYSKQKQKKHDKRCFAA